jgi:hypothetical protein
MWLPYFDRFFTLSGMIKTLFSVGGLIAAAALLLVVLLIFYVAFYRPARKNQVSGIPLLALLTVSAFNWIVVLPFIILFVGPQKPIILSFWWVYAWFPFLLSSLFFFVLTASFIIVKRRTLFPITKERPILFFIGLFVVFEILYVVVCPRLAALGSQLIYALGPDIFKTFFY